MIVSFLAALLLAASALGGCERDTLAAVVNDHDRAAAYVLVTTSGRRLRAYGQDFINPNEWRARDPLDICTGDDSLSLRVRNVRRKEDLVTETHRRTRADAPLQLMNGPGFRALVARVAAKCPTSRVRYSTPAALLEVEEEFEERLDSAATRRLTAAKHLTKSGEYPRCAGRDGASCPANAAMDALERAGFMERFAKAVCAHGDSPLSDAGGVGSRLSASRPSYLY